MHCMLIFSELKYNICLYIDVHPASNTGCSENTSYHIYLKKIRGDNLIDAVHPSLL